MADLARNAQRSKELSKLALELEPFLIPRLTRVTGASAAGGGALVAHALDGAYHTGTLAESQAPWAVTDSEFTAHTSNPNAHHLRQHSMLDTSDHIYTGGNALDVFGLSSTSTLAVLTPSAAPGASSAILKSDSSGVLTLPQFIATTKVRTPLIDTASGDLTIQPHSSLILSPGAIANKVVVTNEEIPGYVGGYTRIGSHNYASQTTGWAVEHIGAADFRYIYTDELHAKAFIADLEQALAGGQIIAKSVTLLFLDFTAPSAGGTTTVTVRDLPSATGMAVFQDGDIIRLRQFSRSGGALDISDCWGVVTLDTSYGTSGFDGDTKSQRYTFVRSSIPNAGGMTAGTIVFAESIVLDYGTSGNGYYEVNAIDGIYAVNSPYAQVVTWTGHPHSGKAIKMRLGNLTGITDTYLSPTGYGLYSDNVFLRGSISAANGEILIDDDGVRIRATELVDFDPLNALRIEAADATEMGGVYGKDYGNAYTIALNSYGTASDDAYTQIQAIGGSGQLATASVYATNSTQSHESLITVYADDATSYIRLDADTGGLIETRSAVVAYDDIYPNADLSADLGTSIKRWNALYVKDIIGDGTIAVTGNITVSGTVDGVDVAAFKTAYDSHNHNSTYLALTGGTLTGTLTARTILMSANNTYDLGSSSAYVLNGYIRNLYTDTIVGTPSYSHTHAASDITSGTLDAARIPTTLPTLTLSGTLTIDADATSTYNSLTWKTDNANNKFWYLVARAHDFATSGFQNDLLMYTFDGSTYHAVYDIDNATQVFNFAQTPTVGGTAVSLSTHDHSGVYVPVARTVTASSGLTGGGALSSNITISHDDTSSQASVNNSGSTFIQDVTLDTFGHVTALTSVDVASTLTGYLLGASTVGGTTDWNDVTNTTPNSGTTLLLGSATNGMGGSNYFHPINFEFSSKTGTGNVTQWAVPYGNSSINAGFFYRGRFSGTWSSWYKIWTETTLGSPASSTVSSTNNAIAHTHAVTSSSAPGAAASLLASDASGFLTLPQFTATSKVRTPLIDTASGALTITPSSGITTFSGGRPVSIDAGAGNITKKGQSGGWTFGLHALGSADTDLGGFGFFGSSDTLTRYYVGPSYTSPYIAATSSGVGFGGQTSPSHTVDVTGTGRFTGALTVAGVTYIADGAVGTPGLAFTSDTNTGIYRSGTDAFSLVSNGTAIVNIGATGAGINTVFDSTAALKVQASATDDITLFLKQKASQTGRMLRVEDSAGQELIVLDSVGNLQSGNPGYVSGLTGWQITPTGNAEFNNATIRGELHASIFVMDEFHASGGTLVVAPAGKLENDTTVYTTTGVENVLDIRTTSGTGSGSQLDIRTTSGTGSGTQLTSRWIENYLDITDPPSGHATIFAVGDTVRIKALGTPGVGLDLYDVWGTITYIEDQTTFYRYFYERRSGGADGIVIPAGTAVVSYGSSGDGRILLTADQSYAPYIDIFTSGASPWSGEITPHTRIGRLDGVGLPGVSGIEQYGIVTSTDLSDAAAPYMVMSNLQLFQYNIDSEWNNGNPTARITSGGEFRLGTDVDSDSTTGLLFNPTTGNLTLGAGAAGSIVLEGDGDSYFSGVMTIGSSGEIRQGTGTLGVDYTGLRIWQESGIGRIGGYNSASVTPQWQAGSDGKLYAGGGNTVLDSSGFHTFSSGTEWVRLNSAAGLDLKVGSASTDELPAITWRTTVGTGNALARVNTWDNGSTVSMRIGVDAPSTAKSAFISIEAYNADSPQYVAGMTFAAPATGSDATIVIYGKYVSLTDGTLGFGESVGSGGTGTTWTTTGYRKSVAFDTSYNHAIVWKKGVSGISRGMVFDNSDVFRIVRSTADNNSAVATTDLSIDASGNVGINGNLDMNGYDIADVDTIASKSQTISSTSTSTMALSVNMPTSSSVVAQEWKYNNSRRGYVNLSSSVAQLGMSAYDNGSGVGPSIVVDRNSNGSTPAAGNVRLTNRGGTDYYIWPDASANLRIGSSAPTSANDTSGTVIGTQTSWIGLKENVQPWDDTAAALETVAGTDLYSYKFKNNEDTYHGFVITEKDRNSGAWFAENLAGNQVPSLNERNLFGYLTASTKALYEKIKTLETQIFELRQHVRRDN